MRSTDAAWHLYCMAGWPCSQTPKIFLSYHKVYVYVCKAVWLLLLSAQTGLHTLWLRSRALELILSLKLLLNRILVKSIKSELVQLFPLLSEYDVIV